MSVIGRFQSRTAHQFLCLLLCVCTWRGPVPVLHNHASLPDAAHQLQHSLTCHDAAIDFSAENISTDWHWHFALWSDIGGSRSCGAEQLAAEADGFVWTSGARMLSTQVRDLHCISLDFGNSAMLPGEFLPARALVPMGILLSAPSSFLASLRAECPLVAVTGVSLI